LGAAVFVRAGGTLTIDGTTISGGTVTAGTGPGAATDGEAHGPGLFLDNVALTAQAGTISDGIAGTGSLTKTGAGTLVLGGAHTYTGATTVAAGTLQVDGTQTGSAVTVQSGATLGGAGTVGSVAVDAGGAVAPGASAGTLTTGAATFAAGSTLAVELNGTTPGAQYDRLLATAATLNGATLNVALGFAPAAGTSFTIVTNAAGTFAGLPQGGVLIVGATTFTISYTGGGGSDVVLTSIPGTSTPSPAPTAPPPYVSPIGTQHLAVNGRATIPFTATGSVIDEAIAVSVSSAVAADLDPRQRRRLDADTGSGDRPTGRRIHHADGE
jgi:autotransporter-associated beta strand protein